MTIQTLLSLKSFINEINDPYLVRFTVANKDLSEEDFEEKFESDQEDRAEAVAREEKRQSILLEDLKSLPEDVREEMLIQLQSVSANGETSNASATAE